MPALQAPHEAAFALAEKVPAAQLWHVPPLLNWPGCATQSRHALLPAADVVPAGHERHEAAPAEGEYVLAGQGEHDDAPADDQEPGVHALHAALALPEEAEPAGHCSHCVAPTIASISHT